MKKMNKKGFTIVELVIVIAVIAILAAVLIPTFSGVVSRANSSAALQEATSVMKSSLAMSEGGTLAEGTIFAIGDAKGANYMFKYEGNKINEMEKHILQALNGGTTGVTGYDRIIVNDDAINGHKLTDDAAKIAAIIKDVFDLKDDATNKVTYTIALADKGGEYTDKDTSGSDVVSKVTNKDTACAFDLVITETHASDTDKSVKNTIVAVYVNSDYPLDAVTFVPATK